MFTPFARAWRERGWPEPAATPRSPDIAQGDSHRKALDVLEKAVADAPFDLPAAGEEAAWRRWRSFRDDGLASYSSERNRPDHDGTSRLSPYLHLGVLHPRSLLAEIEPLRNGAPLERFARHADAMLEEREFFIRKAIGWVLREVSKGRPEEVVAFIAPRTGRASSVTPEPGT